MIRDARRRKPASEDTRSHEEMMLRHAAGYLAERGYAVMAIAANRVACPEPPDKFEFVIKFTGSAPAPIERIGKVEVQEIQEGEEPGKWREEPTS